MRTGDARAAILSDDAAAPFQETAVLGLTTLGFIHTVIAMVAVIAAVIAFIRDGRLRAGNTLGKVYVWTTVLTCLTGFGIFQHGGWGKPHTLGVITLVVLGVVMVAARTRVFGRASRYIESIGFSMTFVFHLIPAITETSTRLPQGKPLVANADAPELVIATGIIFALFIVASVWQVRVIRRSPG